MSVNRNRRILTTDYMIGVQAPRNYIPNASIENGVTTGWSPVTFTFSGGVPVVPLTLAATQMSISANSNEPIYGSYSLLLTKNAANAQYQGFISDIFYLEREDYAKVLYGSFSYEKVSGTVDFSGTSTQTYEIWIFDVQYNRFIQPSGWRGMNQGNGIGKVVFSFQSFAIDPVFGQGAYRVAIITQQTSTAASVVKFDDFELGTKPIVLGAAMTDWVDRGTITIGGSTTAPTKGTTTTDKVRMRRVGDTAELNYEYFQTTSGTTGSGSYLVSLPTGMSFDLTKINVLAGAGSGTRNPATPIGSGVVGAVAGTGFNANFVCYALNATQFTCVFTSSQNGLGTGDGAVDDPWSNTAYDLSNSNFSFKAMLRAPIAGWGSFSQVSNDTDTRVVAARYTANSGSTGGRIQFNTRDFDTHAAVTTGASWVYTAPVSGIYKVQVYINVGANNIGSNAIDLYKNGVVNQTLGNFGATGVANTTVQGAGAISLNAGETIYVNLGGGAVTINNAWITVERLSGPSVITATETVAASYYVSTNFAASTTTPANYDTREFDTHGAVTTGASWKFTAPVSGIYKISVGSYITTGGPVSIQLYKNGSDYKRLAGGVGATLISASTEIKLLAGEYVDIRPNSAATFQGSAIIGNTNYISITRVGN